eukprot:3934175-Rhodomonas_salina.4
MHAIPCQFSARLPPSSFTTSTSSTSMGEPQVAEKPVWYTHRRACTVSLPRLSSMSSSSWWACIPLSLSMARYARKVPSSVPHRARTTCPGMSTVTFGSFASLAMS